MAEARLITVDDPDDPRLHDYTDLTDVELRRRREPAEGLFIAEGEKVIRRAVDAGYIMRSMLLSAKWVDVMRDVIDRLGVPVYVVAPELAEKVTGYHVHRGALASMQRKPLPAAEDVLAGARRVAVMESVNDHTNIGAIFRSAAALGMDAVLLSPDCADPLYRRSVKVSMGAVFSVPYARLDTWPRGLDAVRDAGFALLALTPRREGPAPRRGRPAHHGTRRADARRGGRRPVPAGPRRGRHLGPHPHVPRRRLPQRGSGGGRRVLRGGDRQGLTGAACRQPLSRGVRAFVRPPKGQRPEASRGAGSVTCGGGTVELLLRVYAAPAAEAARGALTALHHADAEGDQQSHHDEHEQPLPQQPRVGGPQPRARVPRCPPSRTAAGDRPRTGTGPAGAAVVSGAPGGRGPGARP
ncbi:hypothetical protein GCM10020256_64280 [Streptomyces thermocoprophilus]